MESRGAASARESESVSQSEPARGQEPTRGFEQYNHEVYGWAYRLLGQHHDALDVVQEVFLKWQRQCAIKPPRSPRGWLRRVAVNLAIDLRRRHTGVRSTDQTKLASERAPLPVACGMPDDRREGAIDAIDRETLRDDIAAAMARLSDPQRAVLVAKVYDEMTFAAIAAELELAVSTVKTHYLRAVRAVRNRLQSRWAREEE